MVPHKVYTRPRGYKTFFMLNSTEHEISLGHKNKNTKNLKVFSCSAQLSLLSWVEHERSLKILSVFCQYFKIYNQIKFHAQLSWAGKKSFKFLLFYFLTSGPGVKIRVDEKKKNDSVIRPWNIGQDNNKSCQKTMQLAVKSWLDKKTIFKY